MHKGMASNYYVVSLTNFRANFGEHLEYSVCMYVCIFIKLHVTAQSGPVIRAILCHSH